MCAVEGWLWQVGVKRCSLHHTKRGFNEAWQTFEQGGVLRVQGYRSYLLLVSLYGVRKSNDCVHPAQASRHFCLKETAVFVLVPSIARCMLNKAKA